VTADSRLEPPNSTSTGSDADHEVAVRRTIDAVWRIESAKLIATLTRLVKDVGLAEDLAQDALIAALEQWPASGIPANAGAWLMTTAKRRAIEYFRRNSMLDRKHAQITYDLSEERDSVVRELDAALDDPVGDDLLRLVFMTCHPILSQPARVALTLRLLGGLTTDEIARAFLATESTIAQRIVRAKKTLVDEKIPFEVPRGAELGNRLASVLEVIYLIFNEGYSATAGDDLIRPSLCDEAIRLGRILAGLAPNEPEVHGLVALMELQASRARARVDQSGEPVLLLDQDRSRWDRLLIQHGLGALERAESLSDARGAYTLQAAIAACHARANVPEATDWARIAELYAELAAIVPSPVIELNRAMAVAMAHGPAEGLSLIDALSGHRALASYYLLPAARGDLLDKLGRRDEAAAEFERAASLTRNERKRALMLARASRLRDADSERPS
jgi:RNA polymerase sigma factor (sigma-70 family)